MVLVSYLALYEYLEYGTIFTVFARTFGPIAQSKQLMLSSQAALLRHAADVFLNGKNELQAFDTSTVFRWSEHKHTSSRRLVPIA